MKPRLRVMGELKTVMPPIDFSKMERGVTKLLYRGQECRYEGHNDGAVFLKFRRRIASGKHNYTTTLADALEHTVLAP